MDRLVKGRAGDIELVLKDKNGALFDPDGGAAAVVPVVVKDAAGATAASGNATRVSTGTFRFPLTPGQLGIFDVFTATWTATINAVANPFETQFETVGGFLCTIDDIRAQDSRLADTVKYTYAKLVNAREQAEEFFERICGGAFVRRGRRATLNGDATGVLLLPADALPARRLVSASIGGTALTSAEIADTKIYPGGYLQRPAGYAWISGYQNIAVHFEYGLDGPLQPVPWAIAELAAHFAINSALPERAESVSTDEGTIRFSTGANQGPTGLPRVDKIISQFQRNLIAVG